MRHTNGPNTTDIGSRVRPTATPVRPRQKVLSDTGWWLTAAPPTTGPALGFRLDPCACACDVARASAVRGRLATGPTGPPQLPTRVHAPVRVRRQPGTYSVGIGYTYGCRRPSSTTGCAMSRVLCMRLDVLRPVAATGVAPPEHPE